MTNWEIILKEVRADMRWFINSEVKEAVCHALSTIDELDYSNNVLKQSVSDRQRSIDEYAKTCTEQSAEITQLRNEVDDLTERYRAKALEEADADHKLKVKINENAALQEKILKLERQIKLDASTKEELDIANVDCMRLHEENKRLREAIDINQRQYLDKQKQLQDHINLLGQDHKKYINHLVGVIDKARSILQSGTQINE
jgi:DNA repair exonuclease SbcCD ATPase subunit